MCFTKSSPSVEVEPQDPVIRHEANADLTKNSKTSSAYQGFRENIKTFKRQQRCTCFTICREYKYKAHKKTSFYFNTRKSKRTI